MIINGENLILGRLATMAAKTALLGDKVDIINCEKIVIVGKKDNIVSTYRQKFDRKTPRKGPFIPRMPDRLVRRMIRGMLPYKKERGKTAFKKIMCHIGTPDNFKNEKIETFDKINVLKGNNINYLNIQNLCKLLGNTKL
ncbi:MAG: 50S ribosomal protein L13 [Nanoarchaeota archaeon]|nr:50S ribosomal protein L13 [Nanoarchaeota archaeon]|tara:strand:+ start:2369 stop:2788 length:420 start_codon:yes stop_codon:yes gene_type:complete